MKSRVLMLAVTAVAAALLAACETTPAAAPYTAPRPPPPPPPPPTPAEEFAWSTVRGTNSVNVVVAFQPGPGQVWSCNGLTEALMPETSYSRGRMLTLYGSAERATLTVAQVRARSAANSGDAYGQFVRTQACDGTDSFTFANLPDGAYFIIAQVKQSRPGGAPDMVIMQRVELARGQAVRITLPQPSARAPAPPPPAPPPRRR